MSIEIERKFLVSETPDDLYQFTSRVIQQGYLAIGDDEVRLRDTEGQYSLTVKSMGSLARAEFETALTQQQFNTLWPATNGRRLEKRRYNIPSPKGLIELDVYMGRLTTLAVAEVEFDSRTSAEQYTPPEWFGVEVTEDSRYKNKNLVLDGIPRD